MKLKNKKSAKNEIVVSLRFLERRDLPKIVNWLCSEDYLNNYLTDYPVRSESALKNQLLKEITLNKFIAAKTQLLVAEAQDNILVGLVILKKIDWRNRHLDLQIYIPPEFKQTNILVLITDQTYKYVFSELNMHKVYTYLLGSDQEKIKIHKQHNHEPEAILYDYIYDGKNYLDLYIYALFKDELAKS